jgi:hypothetical protein
MYIYVYMCIYIYVYGYKDKKTQKIMDRCHSHKPGKGKAAFYPESGKHGLCGHLDFRLLASRTTRQYISVVLGHVVGGNL